MKRVKLTIAYDGTNYCGWQIQPNATAVEAVLNRRLSELLHEDIKVTGASRTDSGVHALGNVAVFCTEARMPTEKICYALNQRLPDDIRVVESTEVPLEFHPRRCLCEKTYEYLIYNHSILMPYHRFNTHFVYLRIDLEQMQKAAQYLIGKHDFKSFCSLKSTKENTVRTVTDIQVTKEEHMLRICITGNGFLYNMVRIIVGTLLKVGKGELKPEDVKDILEKRDRSAAGPTAPAKGLTLVKIEYFQKEQPEHKME